MDQLPQAAVCEPVFCGGLVLRKAFGEDGSQRLVSAVVGCGIGVQEEPLAARVVHGGPLRCEFVFGGVLLWSGLSKSESEAKPVETRGLEIRRKPIVFTSHSVG
jgi:hypothetical protein